MPEEIQFPVDLCEHLILRGDRCSRLSRLCAYDELNPDQESWELLRQGQTADGGCNI